MGKLGTIEKTVEIDGKAITFEAGRLAQLAGGAVVTGVGDTKVLTTTTASSSPREHLDFFPLTIDVEERMYAAGRIPGSFFKREGRPSTNAVLTCRLTDRPLRPTFVDGLRNEVQVVNTILQTTQIDPYDVVAMNGASVATMLAGVPFHGPVAATRYALMRDGQWRAFPSFEELEEEAVFNMVVAGRVTENDEVAILMIEAEATPTAVIKIEMGAPRPTEELIGQAIEDVKDVIRTLCAAQQAFVDEVGARPDADFPTFPDYSPEVHEAVKPLAAPRIEEIYRSADWKKDQKGDALSQLRDEVVAGVVMAGVVVPGVGELDADAVKRQAKEAFRSIEKSVVRRLIVDEGIRIDGRKVDEIRPLSAEVEVLPRTHGSAIFQRGETQALSVLALGSMRDNQRIDTLDPEETKYYMHHYNFPPYSTGETGRVGTPKRREIGHGALAERAIVPVLPPLDEWPYTMRIVSDILASNGSTSMASVCGSSLALMDGGVPIHAAVAGIAMGLVFENGKYTTLTDIQGTEDFFGDMDFKVAGTAEFVTALQLDTKLAGIPADVLADALLQARSARTEVLDVMQAAIAEPRPEVAEGAPRVEIVYIPQDKIGDVIGPRGKIIKEITEETGADIDIDEEDGRGVVRIYANKKEVAQAALDRVNAIANPVLPEVGERYNAPVVKTVDFGAFVSLTPGLDGLVHISELSKKAGRRLDHAEDAVAVGETLLVEVKDVLDGGRKFKLEYVGEKAERSGDDAPRGGGERDRGGDRGGRERSDRGDRARRDRGDRGDRERGDRGDRPRGDRERGDRPRADQPAETGEREQEGGDRDSGDRRRTRARTRDRD